MHRALCLNAIIAVSLSACAVGPDFVVPAAPQTTRFTPEVTASPGAGQKFRFGAQASQKWWSAFHSKHLDALIEEALARNPTLEAAEAAIRIAQFEADAARGPLFPQINIGSASNYIYSSGYSTTTTVTQSAYSFFSKQVNVSFSPDIWGGTRRTIESLEAQKEVATYQKQAAHLTLAADVAKAAIEEATLRAEIATTRKTIGLEQQRLTLLERQLAFGAATSVDILSQQTALAQSRQTLPALETRLAQQRNLLAKLAGRNPYDALEESFELVELSLPHDMPVSLPAQIVSQRPDLKAAEAQMHAASARIGIAVAARLPNVTLTGDTGSSAFKMAQLFAPGTNFYTLAGNIAQPVLDGATLLNKQRAAEAGLDEAEARYKGAVANAFQNVADALRALQGDALAVKEARIAEVTSRRYFDKIRTQENFGTVSQLAVIDAQRAYLATSIARVRAESQRLSDSVALFLAIGGGETA
ncbi:efflux transporter outer membrane subunit [Methylosinus sporium]|uniref:Efflux transporter outer membrane subunit n=1 Tax=Methylosinus sporium TaxID=428 RepID=A0A549ST38_METSR|nr:efflux transporter outer membrane subunit [Methylosinus sporium]TRL32747.1 efflux transporter outer membrane subunit [Methylosinus sporium]